MIIQEFSVGNFKSFKDIQTLHMSAADIKSKGELDKNNVISGHNEEKFLKTKALYGANASGKSNLLMAFSIFQALVSESLKNEDILRWMNIDLYTFKLSTENDGEPIFFELIFWIDNRKYRYDFMVDENKIHSEWLFATHDKKEIPYFIREEQTIIKKNDTHFEEAKKLLDLGENRIFNEYSLFLSVLASFEMSKISRKITEEFRKILIITNTSLLNIGTELFIKKMIPYNNMDIKNALDFLQKADIGIDGIKYLKTNTEKGKEEEILFSERKKYDKKGNEIKSSRVPWPFTPLFESEGTIRSLKLFPYIDKALKRGSVLIIDEIDMHLHPLLAKKIVQSFNSTKNKGAQLIYSTHNTNLLSSNLLRRDQIDFLEKDRYGASHISSLVEFKENGEDKSFEKDYIKGNYGAIPYLGDFEKLFYNE